MPDSKEILLNLLSETRKKRKEAISPFQLACLDKYEEMIRAIPVDEKTEVDLRICGFLLDQGLCDLDKRLGSEHTILSLINKDYPGNDDFCEKVNQILDNEIKKLNKYSSDSFYDQSFKKVKLFLIDMKNATGQLKSDLDQKASDAALLSLSEYRLKYISSQPTP